MVSQKCQYALRAIFELAKHYGDGPVKIARIAKLQAIPLRFLEVILAQLKQAGFVDSQRGVEGGYFLLRPPGDLAVGEVIQFIEGPIGPVECIARETKCPLYGGCVFQPMWEKARKAVSDIYGGTTFEDLVGNEIRMRSHYVPSYSI